MLFLSALQTTMSPFSNQQEQRKRKDYTSVSPELENIFFHSSIIHNGQKVEITQVSTDEDKQNVRYIHICVLYISYSAFKKMKF